VFVYFHSDRSRGFRGFRLDYSLSCSVFEYIPARQGPLDVELASPGYPRAPTPTKARDT
jgi:hypothetical protein